jgi:hypothetical protein
MPMGDSELVMVPIDSIEPCPIQPRVNVSVDLVAKLAASMKAGRHEPVLEVEPFPGRRDRYQIVCGEQRWRAAREAGLAEVLVRVYRRLGYLERIEKQYEENHLRAELDAIEDAHAIVLAKTLRDVAVAERLLRDALVPFHPLDDKRVTSREEFGQHLVELRHLLVKHKIDGQQLSAWPETEKALGVSETQRKSKVGILRLDPELQERLRPLPAEHAIQISRLPDPSKQAELVARAPELTYKQLRAAVESLRRDPDRQVADVADPLAFESRLAAIADLCRQLARSLRNLKAISEEERAMVAQVLTDLSREMDAFENLVT